MQLEKSLLKKQQANSQSLVENKMMFAGPDSELSIYYTNTQASRVRLDAPELMYCGMVKGKKIMHAGPDSPETGQGTLFLPHESFVMPAGGHVDIDFPDADETHPTTCLTIEISKKKVEEMSERMRIYTATENSEQDWEYQPQIIHSQHTSDTQELLERMVGLYTTDHPDKALLMDLSLSELIIRLLRQQGRDFLLSYSQQVPDSSGITAAIYYLEKNLILPLDIAELCKHACMSRSKLYVAFKKQLGCSPGEFQQQLRLKMAADELKSGQTVTNACFNSGFSDLSHFSRRFTQFFNSTPSDFRAKYQIE
jgi:AraC-like DNA-binding protein